MDGVYLEKQNDTAAIEATPSLTSARGLSDLTGIDRQLMQKLDYFLRSHVVKMDMSEGREKHKKGSCLFAFICLLCLLIMFCVLIVLLP